MADLTMRNDTTNNVWVLEHSTTGSGQTIHILQTENTFLDKNISLKFSTPAAQTPTVVITDKGSTNLGITTTASGGYYSATASLTATMSFGQAGWIQQAGMSAQDGSVIVGRIPQSTLSTSSSSAGTAAIENGVTPNVSTDLYVNITQGYEGARYVKVKPMSEGIEAAATVSITGTIAQPTVAYATQTIANMNQININPTTVQPTSANGKYFISIKSTANDVTPSFGSTITTNGYLGVSSQITGAAGNKITGNNSTYYMTLPTMSATVTGTATASTPSATATTAVVSSKTPEATTLVTTVPSSTAFFTINVTAPATTASAFSYTKTIGEGYATQSDTARIATSMNVSASNKTYYVPIPTGQLKANDGSVTATGTSNISFTTTATAPSASDAHYITIKGYGNVGIQTKGWLTTDKSLNSNTATSYLVFHSMTSDNFTFTNNQIISTTAGYVDSNTVVQTITERQLSTATTKPNTATFSEKNVIVPSGGYLVLNAGYYSNQFVSLATLIPDGTTAKAATVATMLEGYMAYDKDGNLLTGTIPTYTGIYTYSG